MSKVMLVNVTHVEESRVAVVDNGVLEEYEIETINRAQIRGNIYNAVVENVHPTLEAAFLKITPEMNGFLPLDEVNFNLLPVREESRRSGKIGRHLSGGQRLMAQVVREPFAGKPPTVSTYFSLPGRYLVLMPGVDSAGVSRKIEDAEQRERLKTIVQELSIPEGFGVIVRTAGLGRTKSELQRDLRYLLRLWQSVQRGSKSATFPSLVYREADLVIRTIRDHLAADVSEVWIDNEEVYEKALAFVRDVVPTRAKTLRLYTGDRPLFNKFNLEQQIESIYKRRVPLESGGEIVIDGTEALTAIDVNSARSRRKGDAEDTILQTNLQAATEIARQLRLRDLGGLIVIDFIDMGSTRNKKKVEETLKGALRRDKAKHDTTRISKLGLVEIARQRLKAAKMAATYSTCANCDGYGLEKTPEAAALSALRKLQTRSTHGDVGRIKLVLPEEVATWMLNNKREDLLQIERRNGLRVDVEPRASMLRHETSFETFPRVASEAPAARTVDDRVPPLPPSKQELERSQPEAPAAEAAEQPRSETPGDAAVATPADGEAPRPRRRRRRRRRPRSEGATEAPTDVPPDPEPPAKAEPAPEALHDEAPPSSIRADELMPAAVGGASRPRGGRGRRRGRGGKSDG